MGTETDQATGQPECTSYQFTASSHAATLLSSMQALRENSSLCDVTLRVAGEEFKVHRLVLAACSPYFNAMFTNSHLESSLPRVELNDVEPTAIKGLIDFAYTSNLTICTENVQGLLAAANLLQIMSVVNACCEFLSAQIDVENCLGIAAFAEHLSCFELYQTSWRFAQDNFHDVWATEEFLSTPLSLLQELFQSENLHVQSEDEVLECAMRWYEHDKVSRQESIKKLLNHVKLPLIPWSSIASSILTDPNLSLDPEIKLHLSNAKRYQTSPKMAEECVNSPNYSQYLPRKSVGQSQFLYVVGGETTPGRSTVGSVERFSPSKESWSVLAPMGTCRRGVGVTFVNGLLYVVGGSDGIQALRLVECYDPHFNHWKRLPDMQQERSSVAATCLNGHLYAIGGYDGATSCLKSVECFDADTSRWSCVAEMNVSRSMHVAAVVSTRIFVMGGYDGSADLASCEVYDVVLNRWEMLPTMQSPRCMAGVGVLEDRVYVVGGCDRSQSLSSMELYDEEKGEWQVVAEMNEPRSGHGVGVVGRKLFALGGYKGAVMGYSSNIESFDVLTNSWSIVGSMGTERRRFGCCS